MNILKTIFKIIFKIIVFIFPLFLINLLYSTKCEFTGGCSDVYEAIKLLGTNFFGLIAILITFFIFRRLFIFIFKRRPNIFFELTFLLLWIFFLLISYSSVLPSRMAFITKNINFCQYQKRTITEKDCIYHISGIIGREATQKRDIRICEDEIPAKYDGRDYCYNTVINGNGVIEVEPCLNLKTDNSFLKILCLGGVVKAKGNTNICEQAPNLDIKLGCYSHLAYATSDPNLCEKVGASSYNDNNFISPQACYYFMARVKEDPSLCEKSGSLKQDCYYWFVKNPTQ